VLQKNNNIFEISVKNSFRGTYCNHRLNFAVDQYNRFLDPNEVAIEVHSEES